MYKIENVISDIKLQHPGNIKPSFFVDNDTVKTKGIILNKPYKLQITAVAKVKGIKKKRVRSEEFSSTLKDAVKKALRLREDWMEELKREIIKSSSNVPQDLHDKLAALEESYKLKDMQDKRDLTIASLTTAAPSDIARLATDLGDITQKISEEIQTNKQAIQDTKHDIRIAEGTTQAITEMMTLDEACKRYLKAQIAFNPKYDSYKIEKFYDKHIKPSLGNVLLDNIDREDIKAVVNNMKVKRAKLDSSGNKIPLLNADGQQKRYMETKVRQNGTISSGKYGRLMFEMEVRPASERTKRGVYTLINPIYGYINESNKIKYNVSSPASMKGLPTLDNAKKVTVPIEAFTKLYNYSNSYYQKIFVWLMHGRRFGEVSSLDYKDINFDAGTYTIKAENNKAGEDMTYMLTKWQRATLNEKNTSGLIFSSINSSVKRITHGTVSANHWDLNCTMHDLRHIIGNTLVSKGVSIEIIGRILGHKPSKNVITNRYSEVSAEAADEALCQMLKEVLI